MSPAFQIFIGLFFFLLGLGYLYSPRTIERINAILRETLLNDAYIALERRKWGVFFLLLSLLFIFMAYTQIYGPL